MTVKKVWKSAENKKVVYILEKLWKFVKLNYLNSKKNFKKIKRGIPDWPLRAISEIFSQIGQKKWLRTLMGKWKIEKIKRNQQKKFR